MYDLRVRTRGAPKQETKFSELTYDCLSCIEIILHKSIWQDCSLVLRSLEFEKIFDNSIRTQQHSAQRIAHLMSGLSVSSDGISNLKAQFKSPTYEVMSIKASCCRFASSACSRLWVCTDASFSTNFALSRASSCACFCREMSVLLMSTPTIPLRFQCDVHATHDALQATFFIKLLITGRQNPFLLRIAHFIVPWVPQTKLKSSFSFLGSQKFPFIVHKFVVELGKNIIKWPNHKSKYQMIDSTEAHVHFALKAPWVTSYFVPWSLLEEIHGPKSKTYTYHLRIQWFHRVSSSTSQPGSAPWELWIATQYLQASSKASLVRGYHLRQAQILK